MPAPSGYWLVKTSGPGTAASAAGPSAEVQQFPAGQKPPQAAFGQAVYLGTTPAEVSRYIQAASGRLGTPNPTNVPSLGTSAGILGAILGGLGIGAAASASAADAAAADATAAAGGAGGATIASRAARTRPGGNTSGLSTATKAAGLAGAGFAIADLPDFLNFIKWLFHPLNWLRMVEFLTGMLFFYFGLRGSFRAFGHGARAPRPFIRIGSRVQSISRGRFRLSRTS